MNFDVSIQNMAIKEAKIIGDEDGPQFIKPDRAQMIPFKPRRFPAPGSHPVPGGEFPMPEGILII